MKKTLILCLSLLCLGTIIYAQQSDGWHYLFDGKSVNELRGYKMDSFPNAWKVENGALVAQTDVPNVDLVTKDTYTNFDLTLEWAMSKAGNSGIFYNVQENSSHESGNGNSPNWLDNFEFQLLDDIDFNDHEPRRSAGSLYDLITPKNKVLKPVGEFNTARLLVDHGHVEQWINGVKVVEYELNSKEINDLIAKSKYRTNPNFAKSTSGHIMFQHHGQKVWLRNIKIKRL
ncbi:3-keto-disaccharide hydrolase [Mucilaginibacter sp. McL0603]|uniref:3-keto-disaccharide hydrolase n=1 Tax=Mucilaginibacter sp. McL0603 TaxID=3415670 RepID=UPI003CF4FB7E